jgi:hypothetical protein
MKRTLIGLTAALAMSALAGAAGVTTVQPATLAFDLPPQMPPRLAFDLPPQMPPRLAFDLPPQMPPRLA